MIDEFVANYLARAEARIISPVLRVRTISPQALTFTVLLSCLAAGPIAALSFIVYIPGLS
jgi:hypothetical protein